LWPVEVRPTITTIHFPAHFETKTILKIVPWRDELLMQVVDERSAPTSEPNPDIIEELLTKAGRLWKTQPGRTNATLLAARGMPESIYSFLVEKDRLWVSGKDFGYLDLNGSSFHRCQAGQGPEAPSDHALAASDGNLYTMRQSQIASFNPVSSKWTDLGRPARRRLEGEAPASLAASEGWLFWGSSGAECCNLRSGLWTNVPGVSTVHCLSEEKSGFWIGADSGLHFFEPTTGSLQSWQPPRKFSGLWDTYRPINLKKLAEAPGGVATGYPGFISFANTLPSPRSGASPSFHYPKSAREPFGLDSHIPGRVTSCIRDGDRLWLGLADRLLLLDFPSHSLVACCRFGKPVVSIGVSDEFVWVGLAFGEQLLVQVPKRAFAAVPKNQWTPLTITAEERRLLIESMNVRDQAVYAFYAGDANRVVQLLKTVDLAEATLEQMLLLAVSYDADETDSPENVSAWCERIMEQYPGSPWGTFGQKAIDESQQNHSFRQHEKQLLAKFDRNHDGVLDAAEKQAMKDDPEFKRIQRTLEEELLTPQIDALIRRYDRDGDGKFGRRELENVKNQVRSLLNLGPENFPNNKLTPLITSDFPSVDTLLQKYDRNKDGALDASELRAFALDLQK
jgi:Ca2+-binding EF-hand superfamily protein